MNSTYVNAAFEFESTNPKKFVDKASWRGDDALVYANLSEIARRKVRHWGLVFVFRLTLHFYLRS